MRQPRDLFIPNKLKRLELKRSQTARFAPLGMMLTKARFGVLGKWRPTMYRLGARAVKATLRIAKCCVKLTIEQKVIVNMRWNNYDKNIFYASHTLLDQVGKVLERVGPEKFFKNSDEEVKKARE